MGYMDHARSGTDKFEETVIVVILGTMTLITFANVVARYGFNENILWALELTVFMFAWLVLLGYLTVSRSALIWASTR